MLQSRPVAPVNDEQSAFRALLAKYPLPSEVVDFPRRESAMGEAFTRIRLQVPPDASAEAARLRARATLTKRGVDITIDDLITREIIGDAVARELLAEACLSEKPIPGSADAGKALYARLFPDADYMAKNLSADEIEALWCELQRVRALYAPDDLRGYEEEEDGQENDGATVPAVQD